jgi:hypothetical protein
LRLFIALTLSGPLLINGLQGSVTSQQKAGSKSPAFKGSVNPGDILKDAPFGAAGHLISAKLAEKLVNNLEGQAKELTKRLTSKNLSDRHRASLERQLEQARLAIQKVEKAVERSSEVARDTGNKATQESEDEPHH